ncbi:hypothetical protein DFA_09350 [Cavenderia fasciculata]|uniref:Uncharacterized protein n=1 Tax=Cavenderia fasciculata TaxID=261658 RepID=F4Q7D8_CACFS|nr:uncharacterized protein DFA_09350 [Cavenderia fasciculata]EGG16320.1 hypothetical protein DFA_09350 [Cavenderia fasciculata]|eukprot:XP_004354704.1 hypothetical protein DFA_09350 [Cavenderia fasciculata]
MSVFTFVEPAYNVRVSSGLIPLKYALHVINRHTISWLHSRSLMIFSNNKFLLLEKEEEDDDEDRESYLSFIV